MLSLKQKIKSVRTERGLSQADLAKYIKVHPHHVSKYERGLSIPSADKLKLIAKALQVSADYLLFNDGEKKDNVEFTNPKLKDFFLAVNKMNKKDQETIMNLIEAIVIKNRVRGVNEDAG